MTIKQCIVVVLSAAFASWAMAVRMHREWRYDTTMKIMQTLPDCQTDLESQVQKSYQESLAEIARLRLIIKERANE